MSGEELSLAVILLMNPARLQSAFFQVPDLHAVGDARLMKQVLTSPLCDVRQHLSGTLAFSHGFQAPVPVQQLEHGHQLLQTNTHISASSTTRA